MRPSSPRSSTRPTSVTLFLSHEFTVHPSVSCVLPIYPSIYHLPPRLSSRPIGGRKRPRSILDFSWRSSKKAHSSEKSCELFDDPPDPSVLPAENDRAGQHRRIARRTRRNARSSGRSRGSRIDEKCHEILGGSATEDQCPLESPALAYRINELDFQLYLRKKGLSPCAQCCFPLIGDDRSRTHASTDGVKEMRMPGWTINQ